MIYPRRHRVHADVAEHYDELDSIYREIWGEHVHHGYWKTGGETADEAVAALSDLVGEKLAYSSGARLVDIGCGYGATARRFAAHGAVVTGFTLSQAQRAAAPPHPDTVLHCRDWLANALPGASFDGAYAIESSEHMQDKPSFFTEARRVLGDGGRFIVCAWLVAERPTGWQTRHLLEPICDEGRLPSLGTANEYRAMAEVAGFSCLDYVDISASVSRTWAICARRLVGRAFVSSHIRRTILTSRNRNFAFSVPRLMLAYRTGAMRYGVFTFVAR